MNNQPYALLSSWGRPNMQNREWLAQTEDDKEDILANENVVAGDKVYVIESKARYVLGLDLAWHNTKAGGGGPLEDIEVEYTANDTYTIEPSTGYYGIGSAEITVNVEPALETLEEVYMENGEYTIRPTAGIDGISEVAVTVNVPAPAAIVEPKTVTLYDYDGTIITQYGAQEFAELQNYPAAPVHEGLTFQSWNWPLATAKQYVAKYQYCDIGATYCTSDGFTKLYLALKHGNNSMGINFSLNGEGDIDWGDGTSTHIIGNDLETNLAESHTYDVEGGRYIIKIGVTGTLSLGGYDSTVVYQGYQSYGEVNLYKVEMANNAILGGNFYCEDSGVSAFATIVISEGTTTIPYQAFASCNALKHITLPYTVTRVEDYAFCYMDTLKSISLSYQCNIDDSSNLFDNTKCVMRLVIPEGNTVLSNYGAYDVSLTLITVPDTITQINGVPYISSITIPSSVTRISSLTGSLISINIPSSVNYLDDRACYGNGLLQKAVIGAKNVGGSQFQADGLLDELTFTSSVESIGSLIFGDSSDVNNIHIITFEGSTPPRLEYDSLSYLPTSCIIRVPQGSLSAYTSAENYPDPNTYTYEEY